MLQDIVVLGGGPAGLSTALHLAQIAPELSSRILILEKAHYPRHKLCGGALTADAEVILQGLGLDVAEIPHVDAAEAHFDFAGRGLVLAIAGPHTLRMIRRDEFDAWLASKARRAGIEIREGVTARSLQPGGDAVLVDTDAGQFDARVVVGADGSNGMTRRAILPQEPIHTARALEVLIPAHGAERGANGAGVPRMERDAHAADVAYFDFAPVPSGIAGYTWDFPTQVNGQPMRCWGVYDTNLLADMPRPPLRQPLADAMRQQGSSLDDVELQGHPIRWFSPRAPLSRPRILLVGDAAGADGIFGEGIGIALGYGLVAAQTIRNAFERQDFSFRDYRRRLLLSPLGRALTARTVITHVLYRLRWAWFQKLFWRVFKPVVRPVSMVVVLNWARRMRPGKIAPGMKL
ncbi:MAG TPA: NAD(P)/FAD-dependent oxidoreductase [Anaerolineales bacterium]